MQTLAEFGRACLYAGFVSVDLKDVPAGLQSKAEKEQVVRLVIMNPTFLFCFNSQTLSERQAATRQVARYNSRRPDILSVFPRWLSLTL